MDELDDPCSLSLMCLMAMMSFNLMFSDEIFASFKTHFIRRTRASVSAAMHELGRKSTNYYRMSDASFWKLRNILKDKTNKRPESSRRSQKKRKRAPPAPNGLICASTRLSAALRTFAGGYPLGIALVRGISPTEVGCSVWKAVDTAHSVPSLNIKFLSCHFKQRDIRSEFEKISSAGFDNRSGCIGGLLT